MATGGVHIPHLLKHVVRPALAVLPKNFRGRAAERLLIGTALTESEGRYLKQLPNGPALGFFQMEPATHDDIWENYLAYHDGVRGRVEPLVSTYPHERIEQLKTNLLYAAVMCRIHYWRDPNPLPVAEHLEGLGLYWKRVYNTRGGAGHPDRFVEHLSHAVDFFGV